MFHLLVKYDGWAPARDSLDKSRVFEYTDDHIAERFKPRGTLDSEQVSRVPALFASESGGSGSQVARVGYITRAILTGTKVTIEYSFESVTPQIPNKTLNKISGELDIEGFELSRTHWAIKDVDLFKVLLINRPSTGVSPKVFTLDEAEIVDDQLISVMMPFDSHFDDVYDVLRRTAEDLKLKCLRADDIWDNAAVIQDVVSLINRSRIVVCDCSGRNPNVFYEVGIAHTLGREVILITQSKSDIPFDLRHLRYVTYLNNNEGRQELSSKLKRRIKKILT